MQPLITNFDKHVPVDIAHVSETAQVLRIREVEVFRHAHQWWYQQPLSESALNRAFGRYLMDQDVPAWVRHYCRRVLNLEAVGQLDPKDFGVEKPTVLLLTTGEQRVVSLITLGAFLVYLLFFA